MPSFKPEERKNTGASTVKATEARGDLYRLIDQVNSNSKPVTITGKRGNAVLIGEQDWNSIQETLYLYSVPGMRESIVEGMNTPLDQCDGELDW